MPSNLSFVFAALATTPGISVDGSFLYYAGVDTGILAIASASGEVWWRDFRAGSIQSRPVHFDDGNGNTALYVVESQNGIVRQYEPSFGTRLWEFSCSDVPGVSNCEEGVEAEFR